MVACGTAGGADAAAAIRSRSSTAALRLKVSTRMPLGVAAPGDPGGDRLDERGGLAGARPGEDQQRPVPVVNHRALRCVQDEGEPPRAGGVRTSRYAPAVPRCAARRGCGSVPGGGGGAHVVRRSWWVCWW